MISSTHIPNPRTLPLLVQSTKSAALSIQLIFVSSRRTRGVGKAGAGKGAGRGTNRGTGRANAAYLAKTRVIDSNITVFLSGLACCGARELESCLTWWIELKGDAERGDYVMWSR